ncbi:MAG: lipase family alpha/beta hydrolase [Terriglobales bacterium]
MERKQAVSSARWAALLTIAVVAATSVAAGQTACTPSGQDPHKVGIVLLHGKNTFIPAGMVSRVRAARSDERVLPLAKALRAQGYRVVLPEMPWSSDHVYDISYDEAMDKIAAEVAKLKAAGAEKVVVIGHSMGGNAALGYGALKSGEAAIIAIAPGVDPAGKRFRAHAAESVETARAMVAEGKGGKKATFDDFNAGEKGTVTTTAEHYLSYFDPDSHAVIPRNVAKLAAGTPLLWVAAQDDPLTQLGEDYAFSKAPANPFNRYVIVPGRHQDAPVASVETVIAWLKCL